jgi:hypothetical protein
MRSSRRKLPRSAQTQLATGRRRRGSQICIYTAEARFEGILVEQFIVWRSDRSQRCFHLTGERWTHPLPLPPQLASKAVASLLRFVIPHSPTAQDLVLLEEADDEALNRGLLSSELEEHENLGGDVGKGVERGEESGLGVESVRDVEVGESWEGAEKGVQRERCRL